MAMVFLAVQCKNSGTQNKEVPAMQENWASLFDGSSTEHWRDTKTEHFPEHGWIIEEGVLTVLGATETRESGHDIISKGLYSSFELELEVRLSEGANSGIKYIVTDHFPGHEGNFLGLEYQLLDNERHPDALEGKDGNHKMGSLYDMIPAPEDISIHPPGSWNKVRIIVDGDHVEHWLNNEKIIEFNRKSESFRKLLALSKYKDLDRFGEGDEGHILLQGHGNTVSFRKIRIRTL